MQRTTVTRTRLSIPFFLVSLLGALMCGCGSTELVPKERKRVTSPSGRQEVRIAAFDLTPEIRVQQAFIVPSGFTQELNSINSAGKIVASVHGCKDEHFDARWLSDDRLAIFFEQDRPNWVNYVPRVEDVTIVIDNRSGSTERAPERMNDARS